MEVLNPSQERANLSRASYSTNRAILRVRDLSVSFRLDSNAEAHVLKELNFTINPGEIIGLLGESGCGKTTTTLALMGMLPSSARVLGGSIEFHDQSLLTLDTHQLRKIRGSDISIIYQDSDVLNPVMRVGDQVMEVLRAHRRSTASEMRDEVYSVFAAMDLGDCDRIFRAYPHQLSGGQRRRIAIAQAVVCKPRLVIADEPTAWLDSKTSAEILALFERLRMLYSTAFLLITHDPAILKLADKALVMYAGQIIESGPIDDLFAQPKHPYTRALLECSANSDGVLNDGTKRRLPCIPGQAPDPSEKLRGCSFSSRCPDRMEVCDLRPPELIEIAGRSVRCFKYGDGA